MVWFGDTGLGTAPIPASLSIGGELADSSGMDLEAIAALRTDRERGLLGPGLLGPGLVAPVPSLRYSKSAVSGLLNTSSTFSLSASISDVFDLGEAGARRWAWPVGAPGFCRGAAPAAGVLEKTIAIETGIWREERRGRKWFHTSFAVSGVEEECKYYDRAMDVFYSGGCPSRGMLR